MFMEDGKTPWWWEKGVCLVACVGETVPPLPWVFSELGTKNT